MLEIVLLFTLNLTPGSDSIHICEYCGSRFLKGTLCHDPFGPHPEGFTPQGGINFSFSRLHTIDKKIPKGICLSMAESEGFTLVGHKLRIHATLHKIKNPIFNGIYLFWRGVGDNFRTDDCLYLFASG